MADLIDRQTLAEEIESLTVTVAGKPARWYDAKHSVLQIIAEQAAVDAVEVVHGRWEKMGEADYKCSVCGFRFTSCDPVSMFLYCRCGAKMDGERREENG